VPFVRIGLQARAYRVRAMLTIDDATSGFLHSAADDLQRQLGTVAVVDRLTVEKVPRHVTLVATLRVGARSVDVRGHGANLVAAYADLRLTVPAPVLAAAFAEVVERRPGHSPRGHPI
jgi:hypothetical protein